MIMAALFAKTELELRVVDAKNNMVSNFNATFMKKRTLTYLLQYAQLQIIPKFEKIKLTNFYNCINSTLWHHILFFYFSILVAPVSERIILPSLMIYTAKTACLEPSLKVTKK